MMEGSISRNSILLGLFAVMTTTIIAGTFLGTQDLIVQQKRKAEEKALLQIMPAATHDNSMLDDTIAVGREATGLGLRSERKIFVARQGNAAVAVILPAIARDGYGGDIDLIIGIRQDGTVAGVRALAHKETPGLGDKVDLKKSDWILDFNQTSLQSPAPEQWKVKKDHGYFDQFTGATITPRAVVAAVKRALDYFADNRQRLLADLEAENG
jgi:electron transport complex protein RnfG